MKEDNIKWIDDYVSSQFATIEFKTDWLRCYTTVNTSRAFEYVDKDKKIRDLEARVKELESILEEEI